MANVCVAFKVLKGVTPENIREGKVKPRFKYVGTHMVFDIKTDSKLTRKGRVVAGGHKKPPPSSINYSSVVTRESARLEFLIVGLSDLDICACDIGNA